jgi:hypothetical protein
MTDIAEERDALTRALYDVLYTLHPIYGNTSGPHKTIGGAAMTTWCHVKDPHWGNFQEVLDQAEDTLRSSLRRAEDEGRDLDLLRGTR